MYWRLTNKEFSQHKGEGNKQLFRDLVEEQDPLGVLAFEEDEPIGWCSVSPRDALVRLKTSRLLKRVDEKQVWSITCLFIRKDWRRKGLSRLLIRAGCEYAEQQGAKIIEAYPIIPKKAKMPDVFAWPGFATSFLGAGFEVVEQRSETRMYMRYYA